MTTKRIFVGSNGARLVFWSVAALLVCVGPSFADGHSVEEIKAAGELRIGDEASYVPFAFRKDGEIVGYDIDLANEFCKELGVKCTVVDTVWAGIIPALLADRFDIIMGQMDYEPGRMAKVDFSIPYVDASQAMLIRAADKDKIKSLDDLSGKILGVKLGSPGANAEDAIDAQIKKDTGTGLADVKTFDDHPSAYLALADGHVDGVLNSLTTLAIVLRDQPGKFAVVRGIGPQNWAGIATQKGNTSLTEWLNKEILKLKADGTLDKLQVKWFGLSTTLPDAIPELN
jgi:polar amino acid transport system substrate-binding protein